MEIEYSAKAMEDRDHWKKSGNKKIMNRITSLINSIEASPKKGIGKPEQLKYQLSGLWSRRINKEHRIIYEIHEDKDIIIVHSLKGHY